ncbi:type II toxin-antitoxin system Phd/YefM family antitoxin [Sphingomonas sp. 28-62-20]|uniref:type II toxin-antitoxin system Phd/YefM family antitoxin n=1 Tax=Sphingomonas sp. 28-62-20 TaxID=1970433 RepID=UPI0026D29EEC
MEISVRDFQVQVLEALAAAERGERVAITRDGQVIAELNSAKGSASARNSSDLGEARERLDIARTAAGLDKIVLHSPLDEIWRQQFDDPAFSRAALGLPEDWTPPA